MTAVFSKRVLEIPFAFHLIYIWTDVVFHGLPESVLIFLGQINYDVLLTPRLKNPLKKNVTDFCISIFISASKLSIHGFTHVFVEQSLRYRMVYRTWRFDHAFIKKWDPQKISEKVPNFDRFIEGDLATCVPYIFTTDQYWTLIFWTFYIHTINFQTKYERSKSKIYLRPAWSIVSRNLS